MPKVRILSGSQAGSVVDLPETEAQANVDTGFAEYVKAETEDKPAKKPAKKKAEDE